MIEMGKQYKTRDGDEVRLYATGCGDKTPVHGAYLRGGVWIARSWREDGASAFYGREMDLIEVKPRIKRTVWLNVYKSGEMCAHTDNINANKCASGNRVACVKVDLDFEEGEGL